MDRRGRFGGGTVNSIIRKNARVKRKKIGAVNGGGITNLA